MDANSNFDLTYSLDPVKVRIVTVARKPLSEGTVAKNCLKHGTGGLNIDASRINTLDDLNGGAYAGEGGRTALPGDERTGAAAGMYAAGSQVQGEYAQPTGRWPANLILQHKAGCKQVGTRQEPGYTINRWTDGQMEPSRLVVGLVIPTSPKNKGPRP